MGGKKMETEKRLIDANELESALKDTKIGLAIDKAKMFNLIESAPTVEVVRCKDCRYWRDSWVAPDGKHEHGYCHMEDADDVIVGRWDDDFCSYGERRTDV
jgi:hypothetical protein